MPNIISGNMELHQRQTQTLNQQMIQSMKILAMSTSELESYFSEQELENPLLESTPPQELYFSTSNLHSSRNTDTDIQSIEEWLPQSKAESLEEYLRTQIAILNLPEMQENAVRFLAGNLDDRGYLQLHYQDVAHIWSQELYEQAVALLQSFEPCGVGARTLEECLLIQLRRENESNPLPYLLAKNYLNELSKGQVGTIAKVLHVSTTKVQQAKERLSLLNPKPGNGFGQASEPVYVTPDVRVVYSADSDDFQISIAEKYLPKFGLNQHYVNMLHTLGLSEHERNYFTERIRSAQWILQCIERRHQMLLNCTQSIVQVHASFFRSGKLPLRPLSMKYIAEQLQVHPSTISRVIRGKYIECPSGIFPMSHFIVRQADLNFCDSVSRHEILQILQNWIKSEDKQQPYSDQELADNFRRKGIPLSRRTVAKYRAELKIPGAYNRKEQRSQRVF